MSDSRALQLSVVTKIAPAIAPTSTQHPMAPPMTAAAIARNAPAMAVQGVEMAAATRPLAYLAPATVQMIGVSSVAPSGSAGKPK